MKVHCPKCNQKYRIDETFLDKEITCVNCEHGMHFPASKYGDALAKLSTQEEQAKLVATSLGSQPVHASTRRASHSSTVNQKASYTSLLLACLVIAALGVAFAFSGFTPFSEKEAADQPEVDEQIADAGKVVKNQHKNEEASNSNKEGKQRDSKNKKSKKKNRGNRRDPSAVAKSSNDILAGDLIVIRPEVKPADRKSKASTRPTLSDSEIDSAIKLKVTPFFNEHCITCHGPKKEKGDLRVDQVLRNVRGEYAAFHLQNIVDEMTLDNMPPEDEPRPDAKQTSEVIEALVSLTESEKKRHTSGGGRPLRRLTRTEFINIAADYYGVNLQGNALPEDLQIGHFETEAENLLTSHLHVENYMGLARNIAKQFIANRNSSENRQSHKFFKSFKLGEKTPSDNLAKGIISKFSILAKRGRPASKETSAHLYRVFQQSRRSGLDFWQALEEPLAMTMFSIDSLFLFESKSDSKEISALDLANRLSFTLWRSSPDVELVRLGYSGDLLKPEIKQAQIKRMMSDPRFERFITDFTDQWLELPRQDEIAVEERIYRQFDPEMKKSMKRETIEFFKHLVKNNLPITNFIDSDFMVLNEEMASFYGIDGVEGEHFRPVKRDNSEASKVRGGILTHAGILMQGSNGERSHIVERGAFIARKIIDDAPSDPPPNVEALATNGEDFLKLTGPELLRAHANNPVCASCHNKIDPLGVALENFDVIGQFRETETVLNPNADSLDKNARRGAGKLGIELKLETKGVYFNGQEFDGLLGLKQALMDRKNDLGRSYIKALLTYINGRQTSLADQAIIDDLISKSAAGNYPAREIIENILLSDMMTSR